MDGLLLIDKPAGLTSHDVVARVRRATGWSKVGHTGTLDPLATGLLPLVVGRATRLARFLSAADKVYEAEVRVGWATDTYDAQGRRIELGAAGQGGADWRSEQVEGLLDRFRGSYLQAPPPFSAKKVGGVRSYALARSGRAAEPARVRVTVHDLVLLSRQDDRVSLRICCSAGFYVRSFAHELGLMLGSGAHLSALRRTRSGEFDVTAAVPLEQVESQGSASADALVPLGQLLTLWPSVVVNAEGARRVRHGSDLRPCDVDRWPDALSQHVRVLDREGMLLAIAEPGGEPGSLHPGTVVV
jgi:tRNA pseudouridine55 synthase